MLCMYITNVFKCAREKRAYCSWLRFAPFAIGLRGKRIQVYAYAQINGHGDKWVVSDGLVTQGWDVAIG